MENESNPANIAYLLGAFAVSLNGTARARVTRGVRRGARRLLGSCIMSPREKGVAALNLI
jgi:hypothetical protein